MTSPADAAPHAGGATPAQVAQVRAFNRFYTNVIGLLHGLYLDTPYTLTESRLLFEIARHGTAGVPALRQALDIDPGYLSRVLSRFEADGLVTRHRSPADARRQDVTVTAAGRSAVADLDARAAAQIGALLGGVDCGPLLDAMRVITDTLARSARPDGFPPPDGRVVTLRPLRSGDLGWILQRHGTLYAAEFGWDARFEGFCAAVTAEYAALRERLPGRSAGWIAEVDGVPAGSVCCVPDTEPPPRGTPAPGTGAPRTGAPRTGAPRTGAPRTGAPGMGDSGTARLRLLIAEPWARGLGLGARLVDQCLGFARQAGYTRIVLMTYSQLAAARRIYQAAGFTLDHEHPEDAYGQRLTAQSWSRPL